MEKSAILYTTFPLQTLQFKTKTGPKKAILSDFEAGKTAFLTVQIELGVANPDLEHTILTKTSFLTVHFALFSLIWAKVCVTAFSRADLAGPFNPKRKYLIKLGMFTKVVTKLKWAPKWNQAKLNKLGPISKDSCKIIINSVLLLVGSENDSYFSNIWVKSWLFWFC